MKPITKSQQRAVKATIEAVRVAPVEKGDRQPVDTGSVSKIQIERALGEADKKLVSDLIENNDKLAKITKTRGQRIEEFKETLIKIDKQVAPLIDVDKAKLEEVKTYRAQVINDFRAQNQQLHQQLMQELKNSTKLDQSLNTPRPKPR